MPPYMVQSLRQYRVEIVVRMSHRSADGMALYHTVAGHHGDWLVNEDRVATPSVERGLKRTELK